MDKNNGTLVIHLPAAKERQFKRLAEKEGMNASEYGRHVVEEKIEEKRRAYEFMKSVFEPE